MPSPKHSIVFWTPPRGAETDIAVGRVVIPDSDETDNFVVSTTANRGARRSEGVAISEHGGSGFGTFELAQVGTIDASISGLAVVNTGRSLVRCSTTGTMERIATGDVDPDTDDILGVAEEDGRVHLYIGFPFSEMLNIISADGSDGKTVKAMADANQTLGVTEAGKSLYEATGVLTAARNLTVADVATAAASYRRIVLNKATDRQILVGTTTGVQKVAVFPGHRATIEFSPEGARVIHEQAMDPRDFGCVCDGVTDDQPALEAMISSLPAGNLFPATIRLPKGWIYCGDNLNVERPVRIIGEGGGTVWWSQNTTTWSAHKNLSGTIMRFAPLKGIILHSSMTSSDGVGAADFARLSDFDIISQVGIISTGVHGANKLMLDPTYDTRQNATAYVKGRVLLRSGTTATGSGTFDDGATRGGTTVWFRCTTSGTTAGSPPAAIASATLANLGDTITDGTCVWTVESVPKDYQNSTAYVVGQRVFVPGDNVAYFECIVGGTSIAAGTPAGAANGIGVNAPVGMNGPVVWEEFLDNLAVPGGLKWKTYTPCGITRLCPSTRIERMFIAGFTGYGIYASSDSGFGHNDANWSHCSDYTIWYCGGGALWRGNDCQGALNTNGNFGFLGFGRTNVDGASYLNFGAPSSVGGKWGNGAAAILDRGQGGNTHIAHYCQFTDAPAWRNDNLTGAGWASRFSGCKGEVTYGSIFRGSTGLKVDTTFPLIYNATQIELGGQIIDVTYGRGLKEVDLVGYGTKRLQGGLCSNWGTGGFHWFQSILDEFAGGVYGWGYQTTCIDAGTSGTGWYTFGYGPTYARTSFSVGGAKSAEGLGHVRLDRGFFLGNQTDGARYIGPLTEQESVYVRHGQRLVGDLFVDHTATSGYSEQRVTVAGYEGVTWASVSGGAALVCESGTTSYYVASVALKGDQIKLTDGRVVRVTAKTGAGLHDVAEPALASLVTPGDTEVAGDVTYYYVGDEPTYAHAGYIGTISGGAPTNATYVVISLDGTLTNERNLAVTPPLTLTDSGAGAAATLALSGLSGYGSPGQSIRVAGGGASFEYYTPSSGASSSGASGTVQLSDGSGGFSAATNVLGGTEYISFALSAAAVAGSGALRFPYNGGSIVSVISALDSDTVTSRRGVSYGAGDLWTFGNTAQNSTFTGDLTYVNGATGFGLQVNGNAALDADTTATSIRKEGSTTALAITGTEIKAGLPLGGNEGISTSLTYREASVTVAGAGNTTLSDAEAACPIIHLTGTPAHGPDVIFPVRSGATWWVYNGCTGGVYLVCNGNTTGAIGAGDVALMQYTTTSGWRAWV
jgi:hypothetical protein